MIKIFKNESELIKYLRRNGDKIYNNASNDYLIKESYETGYINYKNNNIILNINK